MLIKLSMFLYHFNDYDVFLHLNYMIGYGYDVSIYLSIELYLKI